MKTANRYMHALFLGIIGIIGFIFLYYIDIALTGFPAMLIEVSMGLGGWYLLDKYFLKEVDTVDEIKKNNIALPLVFIAYSLIFAAAIIAN